MALKVQNLKAPVNETNRQLLKLTNSTQEARPLHDSDLEQNKKTAKKSNYNKKEGGKAGDAKIKPHRS